MPVYHFNVYDGSDMPDLEGTELPDLKTAQSDAVKLAGRLLLDEPETFWDGTDWHMEVTNDAGEFSSGSISRLPRPCRRSAARVEAPQFSAVNRPPYPAAGQSPVMTCRA